MNCGYGIVGNFWQASSMYIRKIREAYIYTHITHNVAFACVSVFRDEKSRANLFAMPNHSLMMINEQLIFLSFTLHKVRLQ